MIGLSKHSYLWCEEKLAFFFSLLFYSILFRSVLFEARLYPREERNRTSGDHVVHGFTR